MHRLVILSLCAALLAGCESYGDLTSDAFDPGTASQSSFATDSARCQADANIVRDYDMQAVRASASRRHEMYNEAFQRCMLKDGYARRDWSIDVPDSYAYDLTPD